MAIETGALEQSYIKEETTTYRTPETLVATDGKRHLELALTTKVNREPSPEKRGTPDQQQSLPTRRSQEFDLSSIMWEPSGTLGTPADIGVLIEGCLGGGTQPNLDTTVNAAPAPTATGCTLIADTGLAVGDTVLFDIGAGVLEATRIKTLAALAVTYDALTAAPAVPGRMLAGNCYQLASSLTKSFSVFKYFNAGGFEQAVYGAVMDKLVITVDGTKSALLAFSGPAGEYADSTFGTVQAKPAAYTTVGAPVAGLNGSFNVDGAAFLVTKFMLTIENQLVLRNRELGTEFASGIGGRNDLRKVTLSVEGWLEDTNLITKANDSTKSTVRCHVGNTDGNRVLIVCPSVEWEVPDVGNEIGLKEVTVSGVAYATNGNDQVFLGEA